MSRIGKKPITIPEKTEVTVSGAVVTVKGPNGTLTRTVSPVLEVKVADKQVVVSLKSDTPEAAVLWGTITSHIGNMIDGVNTPFVKRLLVEGVKNKHTLKCKYARQLRRAPFVKPVVYCLPAEDAVKQPVRQIVSRKKVFGTGHIDLNIRI